MIVLVVIAVGLLGGVTFTVVAASGDNVLIQTWGKTTRVYKGHEDAGLKVIVPLVQKVIRYAGDKQQVLVTLFCAWRIKEPEEFWRRIGTVEAYEGYLRGLLRQIKQDVITNYKMEQLINTDSKKMQLETVEDDITRGVAAEAGESYGVEIRLVGIKTLGLPEEVTAKVIEAMKAERQPEIKRHQSEGEEKARKIRERAKEAESLILAFAERKAAQIRSEGDRVRARIMKDFDANPELALFIRELDTMVRAFKENTLFLFNGSWMHQVDWFRKPPGTELNEKAEASSSAPDAAEASGTND
jgi:regulator of protease activity HflC (stomatin/prohibitin superfamily)